MGIFTIAAGGLAAREQGQREAQDRARILAQQEQDRQNQEAERKIRTAALLASLNSSNIVANNQRDVEQPGNVGGLTGSITTPKGAPPGANLVLPTTPNLTKVPGVDASRYTQLGDTGFSLDERPQPSYLEQRALNLKEQGTQRRMATLRGWDQRFKAMPDDALRGIAEDNTTFAEVLKAGHDKPIPDGAGNMWTWDPNSGKLTKTPTDSGPVPGGSTATMLGSLGLGATPDAPKFGLPKAHRVGSEVNPTAGTYEDVYSDGSRKVVRPATATELVDVKTAKRNPNLPMPVDPSLVRQRDQQAVLNKIKVRQTQLNQLQHAMDISETPDPSDTTSVAARAYGALKKQQDSLRTEIRDLTKSMDAPAATARAGIRPVVPKLPAETVPQTALDPSTNEIVMETVRRIRAGKATLADAQGLPADLFAAVKRTIARDKP